VWIRQLPYYFSVLITFHLQAADLPTAHSFMLDRVFPFPGLPILLRPYISDYL
jgi:hypothetical protein